MHECPECMQACDCDGDDTWMDAPDNCSCDHYEGFDEETDWSEGLDDDELPRL